MAVQTIQRTSVTFSSEKMARPYHEHCPLCVNSIVHPEQDNRPPAIIFLDMDGVMIGSRFSPPLREEIPSTLCTLFPQVKEVTNYHWSVAKGKHLQLYPLDNLHSLIERVEASGQRALVVLSSAWRNDATLQQHREEVFTQHSFCKYLCGKTASENNEESSPEYLQGFRFTQGAKDSFKLDLERRADVIEYWLRDHGFDLNSTNFVVIDDDNYCGLQRFGERFVRTTMYTLFTKEHLEQAAQVLKV